MRLGKRQKDILIKMSNGWELGITLTIHGGLWMQKGGLGRGGEAIRNISSDSVWSLYNKHLIKIAYRHFPTQGFVLTRSGKDIAWKLLEESK